VQIRLLACLVGGLLGLVATSPINDKLGFSPTMAFIACISVGIGLGYVVSLLVDVFAPSGGGKAH
jgi:hypothetical protein